MTGLPSGLIAIGSLGADLAYLMYQQFRLIVGIATIYGHEPSHRERFHEAVSCLAYASGVGIGKQGIATLFESATVDQFPGLFVLIGHKRVHNACVAA